MDGRRLGVELICRQLQVAPSSYYAAKTRAPSARAVRDEELIPRLVELWGGELPGLRGPQALESGTAGRDRDRPRPDRAADEAGRDRGREAVEESEDDAA
ncbi:hypothetical protein GCM10010461_10020 [Microbacterium aurantiacum]